MNLVEVAPILKAVAREHKVRAGAIRRGGPGTEAARDEVMRILNRSDVPTRETAAFLGVSHTTVRSRGGPASGHRSRSAHLASRCSRCDELLPLDRFWRDEAHVDGVQSPCKSCHLADDRARAVVGYRRRARTKGGRPRVQCNVEPEVAEVLRDTAKRKRLPMAVVVERALILAMACTDCRKRLRSVGSDCCTACDEQWKPQVVAS